MTDELSDAIAAVKKNRFSFCKFISPNDAGTTGGHQAGLYIPKNSYNLIFDTPGTKGKNKERFANLTWFDGSTYVCCFKYYGVGTRNEYRITRLGKSFQEGQFVVIVKLSDSSYLGFVLTNPFEIDSFLKELSLNEDDANSLINYNGHTSQLTELEYSQKGKEEAGQDETENSSTVTIDTDIVAGVPPFENLMEPTVIALKQLGGNANVKAINDQVRLIIDLSDEDLKEIHKGTTTKFIYRLAWARNYLKRFGIISKQERSVWQLTPKGEKLKFIDKVEIQRAVRKTIDQSDELESDVYEIEPFEEKDSKEDPSIGADDLISPFDPKDIKIIVEPKTIDHLVNRLRYGEIDMNTEFQRKGNLWKPEVQSRLIESILLRLPLPAFYFDATNDDNWLVVDGLQRLWSIKNFIVKALVNDDKEPPLVLEGLEILTDYSGVNITFDKLNRTMQRRILETPITTYLIQPGTPKEVKYNVFRRINTSGLFLNSMEIRNALNPGKPANFLRNLSEDKELRIILKLQDQRMEDRELLLRAYSFIDKNYLDYFKPLSRFLDKAMESIAEKTDDELEKIANGIIDSIFFQVELFGKHIFSRSILRENGRARLNSALFEVWVSEIFKLTENEKDRLIDNRDNLVRDYKVLLPEDDFNRAIATSTSGKGAVKTRFEGIIKLIRKYSK